VCHAKTIVEPKMIKTNKIKLTPNTVFTTLLKIYWRKRWWFIILMLLMGMLVFTTGQGDANSVFIISFSILYPLLIVFQYWRFANSKENKSYLIEREYEIFNDRIIAILSDGTSSTILTEHFVKYVKLKNDYLLYLSKIQFIYVPNEAFKTESDRSWFKENIISKINS